jgi:hypothetical protein
VRRLTEMAVLAADGAALVAALGRLGQGGRSSKPPLRHRSAWYGC